MKFGREEIMGTNGEDADSIKTPEELKNQLRDFYSRRYEYISNAVQQQQDRLASGVSWEEMGRVLDKKEIEFRDELKGLMEQLVRSGLTVDDCNQINEKVLTERREKLKQESK